ncbi:sigma-54 dependent transcriptional regulator [Treponema sp.]
MKETILVIDDNEKLCKSLELNFKQIGYNYHYRLNSQSALQFVTQMLPDIVLLDLALGQEDGLQVLSQILHVQATIPVLMITGFGSIDSAVKAMKIGAADYVQKPLHFPNLLKIIENTLQKRQANAEIVESGIVTTSETMKNLLQRAIKMAKTELPILVVGESGTGKEQIAHYIHKNSLRQDREIQCVNCAAFPENLLDNELFGHEKGAYTWADKQYLGIFEQSHGGSLFMDEIGDMSLPTQAKILRTLQNSEIRRIGGTETIRIDVRFICATNRKLEDLLEQKKFREDLYYRLSACVIAIPPLRERREDIIPLSEYFLAQQGRGDTVKLSKEVENFLLQYDWPGNVRELRNVIFYAGAMTSTQEVSLQDLPQNLSQPAQSQIEAGSLEDYEKTLILRALKSSDNNKKKAAESLNISRRTLYNKLERYGIATD